MSEVSTLYDLPPHWARFCLQIERHLKTLLQNQTNLRLLLCLSGGADSTALAWILSLIAKRVDIKLFACIVHHGLRKEADAELLGVRKLCQKLGIPLFETKVAVKSYALQHHMGLEEAGRKLRYRFFEEVREKIAADFIVTAHHLNDLSEDVLLRLIRGVGWPKLGGMCEIDQKRHLLRPLLKIPKKTLQKFLIDLSIPWFEDASNSDLSFTRNRVRHTIVPLFLQENPRFSEQIERLNTLSAIDAAFWKELLKNALKKHPWKIIDKDREVRLTLPKELLVSLPKAARLRLYLLALEAVQELYQKKEGFEASVQGLGKTLFSLDETYDRKENGAGTKRFQLGGNVSMVLERGSISVCVQKTSTTHV